MYSLPNWAKNITPDLRPDKKRIKELEKVRNEFQISNEMFAVGVLSSHVTTRKVQRDTLEILRCKYPKLSEKELLKKLLHSRFESGDVSGYPLNQQIEEVEILVADVKSLNEFCDILISQEDEEILLHNDQFGLRKKVDDILLQEENEKIAPAEHLIQSMENSYHELRLYNPDRDEHWFLSNTWLARYGDTKEAKKRGQEIIKFIAYKDTLNFSVLLSPESIRGLALFLVYKELGEELATYYVTEFNLIMEKVMNYKERSLFLEKYKEINPRTWKENREKTSSHYSIYWLLNIVEKPPSANEKALFDKYFKEHFE